MTADDRSFIFQCKLDMNGLSGFIKTREHYLLLWGGPTTTRGSFRIGWFSYW